MIMNIEDYTDHDTTEGLELAQRYERYWKVLGVRPDLADEALLAERECQEWAARVSEAWGVKVTHVSEDHTYEIDTEGMINCDRYHPTPRALAGMKALVEIPSLYGRRWDKLGVFIRRHYEEVLADYGDPIIVELDSSTQPPTMRFSDKNTGEWLLTVYPSDNGYPTYKDKDND